MDQNTERNIIVTRTTVRTLGYIECIDDKKEDGFIKVALYHKGYKWTHAAKQLSDGRWKSKLGESDDIEHTSPDALVGDKYGSIYCFMKKKLA